MKTALHIVEKPSFCTREEELWSTDGSRDAHSLHYTISYPDSFPPELPNYFIGRYTKRGDVVLDPFCGTGATGLAATLVGRVAHLNDANPLAALISASKLSPADITEVTLWLQSTGLSKPVSLDHYRKGFSSFYDIDTYRELLNLRSVLLERKDSVSRFVQLLALSLLHGHSAGFFSVYSMPQVSLVPSLQEQLNIRRGQHPDYRALAPRILRKAAMVGRDGYPSSLRQLQDRNKVASKDSRDLSFVQSESVQLVVTAPPLPGVGPNLQDQWLRLWFADMDPAAVVPRLFSCVSLEEWREFMNETLLELARVVKGNGRAVFDLREVQLGGRTVKLEDELVAVVNQELNPYWEAERILVHAAPRAQLKDSLRERDEQRLRGQNRLLILRRR